MSDYGNSPDGPTARHIISCLADGTVPSVGQRFFSHGRERWTETVALDLDDQADAGCRSGRFRLLNGRNGDGKTHLMHILRNLALERHFAYSYIVVSSDVPLHKWDRVYGEISRNVTVPSGRRGLAGICNPEDPAPEIADCFAEKTAALRSVSGLDPDFATALYRYTTRQTVNTDHEQDMHSLAAWLQGNSTPPLKALGIASAVTLTNGAAILRSLVRALHHLGVPGLLLMIDEVESIMSLTAPQRRESYQTLRLLVDGSNSSEHSLTIASTTPPMFSDIERGFQTYPALWSRLRPSDLDGPVNYYGTIIDLTRTPLSRADYVSIGEAIVEIFAIARTVVADLSGIRPIIAQAAAVAAEGELTLTFSPTRVFVRLIVEILNGFDDFGTVPDMFRNLPRAFGIVDSRMSTATY